MQPKKTQPATIDDYIAQYPADVQLILGQIRALIQETVPQAVEKISYGMPAFALQSDLIWFAAWKKHIAIYPRTGAMLDTIPELSAYKGTKGSVHFQFDQPMPYDLIRKIVQVRVEENQWKPDRKGLAAT